jgi:hypothetical protein
MAKMAKMAKMTKMTKEEFVERGLEESPVEFVSEEDQREWWSTQYDMYHRGDRGIWMDTFALAVLSADDHRVEEESS